MRCRPAGPRSCWLQAMASPTGVGTAALITATFESPVIDRERPSRVLFRSFAARWSDGAGQSGSAGRPTSLSPAAEAEWSGLSVGSRVGPYIVLDRIGRGEIETSFVTSGFTAAQFGNTTSRFSTGPEFLTRAAVVNDFGPTIWK